MAEAPCELVGVEGEACAHVVNPSTTSRSTKGARWGGRRLGDVRPTTAVVGPRPWREWLDVADIGPRGDDVAGVHDEPGLLPERLVEELVVRGEHHDAVRGADLAGRPRHARVPARRDVDLVDPRIAVADVAAAREQLAHDL